MAGVSVFIGLMASPPGYLSAAAAAGFSLSCGCGCGWLWQWKWLQLHPRPLPSPMWVVHQFWHCIHNSLYSRVIFEQQDSSILPEWQDWQDWEYPSQPLSISRPAITEAERCP